MQRPVNREASSPMGAYQVWHREGAEFLHVGSLKVGSLAVAAEAATARRPAAWMDVPLPEDQRPTRTDDVIVSPDAEAFRLRETAFGFTFESVDFDALRQTAREAAEHRAELRDGVKTALTAGASFRQVMQEAGWHGMKGDEVAQIREEVERGQGGLER